MTTRRTSFIQLFKVKIWSFGPVTCFFSFRLQSEIKILSTSVFVDPYEEADAQVRIPTRFNL